MQVPPSACSPAERTWEKDILLFACLPSSRSRLNMTSRLNQAMKGVEGEEEKKEGQERERTRSQERRTKRASGRNGRVI